MGEAALKKIKKERKCVILIPLRRLCRGGEGELLGRGF